MKSHLDLCSGVGGFALAAQWSGYTTIGFCEIDPWCRRVLAKNFPGVPQHDDLWTLTGATVRGWIGEATQADAADADGGRCQECTQCDGEPIAHPADRHSRGGNIARSGDGGAGLDLLTGGYPCQPFSLAGKRLGAADDRHLWPAISDLVADLRPARCLFENVAGHITMGLDDVLADLETLGYACGAVVIPAAAVGAPHRRDRVWILADADEQRIDGSGPHRTGRAEPADGGSHVADAAARGVRRGEPSRQPGLAARGGEGHHPRQALGSMGDETARLPGWLVGPDRLNPWAGDWEAGCPRTTTHEVDRVPKLKALGNAIVPQVAYEILRAWNEAA